MPAAPNRRLRTPESGLRSWHGGPRATAGAPAALRPRPDRAGQGRWVSPGGSAGDLGRGPAQRRPDLVGDDLQDRPVLALAGGPGTDTRAANRRGDPPTHWLPGQGGLPRYVDPMTGSCSFHEQPPTGDTVLPTSDDAPAAELDPLAAQLPHCRYRRHQRMGHHPHRGLGTGADPPADTQPKGPLAGAGMTCGQHRGRDDHAPTGVEVDPHQRVPARLRSARSSGPRSRVRGATSRREARVRRGAGPRREARR